MRNKILIVMPSRGRPGQLMEAVGNILKTSSGLVDVLVCQDCDDPTAMWIQAPRVMCWRGPRQSFLEWVNQGVKTFLYDYFVFAWGADDVRFEGEGWDKVVLEHMETIKDIVYGPDTIQDEKLPTHPFIGAAYPRAFGYLVYPKLKHYFADNWIQHVGSRLKTIQYVEELKLWHNHHCNQPDKQDETYRHAESRFMAHDRGVFDSEIYKVEDPTKPAAVDIMRELAPQLQAWVEAQPTIAIRQ